MKLFISHASEDKQDFVRPLADALAKHFEVWYDEYVLTVGDSLQKKIEETRETLVCRDNQPFCMISNSNLLFAGQTKSYG